MWKQKRRFRPRGWRSKRWSSTSSIVWHRRPHPCLRPRIWTTCKRDTKSRSDSTRASFHQWQEPKSLRENKKRGRKGPWGTQWSPPNPWIVLCCGNKRIKKREKKDIRVVREVVDRNYPIGHDKNIFATTIGHKNKTLNFAKKFSLQSRQRWRTDKGWSSCFANALHSDVSTEFAAFTLKTLPTQTHQLSLAGSRSTQLSWREASCIINQQRRTPYAAKRTYHIESQQDTWRWSRQSCWQQARLSPLLYPWYLIVNARSVLPYFFGGIYKDTGTFVVKQGGMMDGFRSYGTSTNEERDLLF